MADTLLKVENLDVGYGGKKIVKHADFEVKEGEILGIVGQSGSSKTTLLKAMMRVKGVKAEVLGGKIDFEGDDFLAIPDKQIRQMYGKEIAVIFQNPVSAFDPIRKIGVQFIESMKAHGCKDEEKIKKNIEEIFISLELTDTERILRSYPFQLSGGMAQRVAIAFAVTGKPKLILADEPTSALDVSVQKQAVEEMVKMRNEFGTAIIMITHNMGVVANMADNIAVMNKGEIVEYGKTEDVLKNPQDDYTKALIDVIPKLGGKLPEVNYYE